MKYNKRIVQGIYKRIINSMSGLSSIDVELSDQGIPSYIPHKKTIIMPSSIHFAENQEEEFMFGRGLLCHEGAHVLFVPKMTDELAKIEDEDLIPDNLDSIKKIVNFVERKLAK